MVLQSDRGLYLRMIVAIALVVGLDILLVAGLLWVVDLAGIALFDARFVVGGTMLAVVVQFVYAHRQTLGVVDPRPADLAAEPRLHDLLGRLSQAADVPQPTVAVAESDVPNTVVIGSVREPTIVVTRGLLDRLDDEELATVLAHELAHVTNQDIAAMIFAAGPSIVAYHALRRVSEEINSVLDLVAIAVGIAFGYLSVVTFRFFTRHREFVADRAAVQLTGNPAALATALGKIDATIEETPNRDLRAEDSELKALCLVPQGFDPDTIPTGEPDEPRRTDWSSLDGIEAIYADQPMRNRKPDATGQDDEPEPAPLPASHPPTRTRIDRLRTLQRELS